MTEDVSHESDAQKENKLFETSYEELYQKARQMTQFAKYSDYELKERLVNLIFSLDDAHFLEEDEVEVENIEENKEEVRNYKIKNIFQHLEKSLKSVRLSKDKEFKNQVLSRKTEIIATAKDELPVIYDTQSLQDMLFKLADEMGIYNNEVFWDFELFNDKDFLRFKRDVAKAFYLTKTSFVTKIWDVITGQKKIKLDYLDPFRQIQIYPKVKKQSIIGSNYFNSKKTDLSWTFFCFGEASGTPNFIPLEQFSVYSLKSVVLSLSKTFDDIFKWSDIRYVDKKEALNKEHKNEGLLFKLVAESYLPVIKMFIVFEHIAQTLPQTPNHPLRSVHLIYFVAWAYVKWIAFMEKSLYDSEGFISPLGETGEICLDTIFERIKGQMDNELVNVNLEDDLSMFHSYFSERENVLTKIDYYKSLIPELKRRLKTLLSTLIADVINDFVSRNGYFLEYQIDERGRLTFIDLFKRRDSSIIDKILSFFKKEKEEKTEQDQVRDDKIKEEEIKPVIQISKPVQSLNDDSILYGRALDDVLTILSAVVNVFNENFEGVNKFASMAGQEEDIYHYLSVNPYFKLNEHATFQQVIQLQDCYELMFKVKRQGNDVIQAIKDKEIPRSLIHRKITLEDNIENLITTMKDSSSTLGLLSQNKEKYQEYGVLLNKLQFVHKEFAKVKSRNR
ncbi:MAG: hypothetical protein OEZ36_04485 [Spirochaetota bacterium]|nr:hypothetical protein [Spirochaetota bacterium]